MVRGGGQTQLKLWGSPRASQPCSHNPKMRVGAMPPGGPGGGAKGRAASVGPLIPKKVGPPCSFQGPCTQDL